MSQRRRRIRGAAILGGALFLAAILGLGFGMAGPGAGGKAPGGKAPDGRPLIVMHGELATFGGEPFEISSLDGATSVVVDVRGGVHGPTNALLSSLSEAGISYSLVEDR